MKLIQLEARALRGIATLALAVFCSLTAFAQAPDRAQPRSENYVIFVSQRSGAAELYLLNLETRQVSQLTNTGRGHLSAAVAPNSRTVVFASHDGGSYELFSGTISAAWRSRRPTIVGLNRLTENTMDEFSPTLSADGAMVAFASGNGIELITSNGAGRQLVIPSSEEQLNLSPVISPDGSQIAFASNRNNGSGQFDIWVYTRAGRAVQQLTTGAAVMGGLSWSADGKRIVFTTTATKSKLTGIGLVEVESGAVRILTDSNDFNASLSARGDRIVFTSTRDGDAELYLLNLNTGTTERLTTSLGADDGAVFLVDPVAPSRVGR